MTGNITCFSLFNLCVIIYIIGVMIRIYSFAVFMEDPFKIFPCIPFQRRIPEQGCRMTFFPVLARSHFEQFRILFLSDSILCNL